MQGFTQYTASTTSAATMGVPPNTIAEEYVPLWVFSSGSATVTNPNSLLYVLQKGSTSLVTAASAGSAAKLHTLSSNWASGQKFAFEASIFTSTSSVSAQAQLYDFTSSSVVSGSLISTTTTSMILLRSGSFTLSAGHVYGVVLNLSASVSANPYLSKAHLVALMM